LVASRVDQGGVRGSVGEKSRELAEEGGYGGKKWRDTKIKMEGNQLSIADKASPRSFFPIASVPERTLAFWVRPGSPGK
jgi:hypothetical protein